LPFEQPSLVPVRSSDVAEHFEQRLPRLAKQFDAVSVEGEIQNAFRRHDDSRRRLW
jgi:hypothetical protein